MNTEDFRPSVWRWWVGVIALSGLLMVFLFAAQWQWGRAAEKDHLSSWLQVVAQKPAVTRAEELRAADLEGRAAVFDGTWLHEYSVLLDNRALDGRPGLWLMTPLELPGGSVVPVLRGWISRGRPGDSLPELKGLEREARVSGELIGRIPRVYELGEDAPLVTVGVRSLGEDAQRLVLEELPRRQNVDANDLRAWMGRPVVDWTLQQSLPSDPSAQQAAVTDHASYAGHLLHQWPARALDADKHRAYALQWISFAAIAVIALGVLLVRRVRS